MDDILTHPAFTAAALFICTGLGGIIGFILRGWHEEERRYRERDLAPGSARSAPAADEGRRAGGMDRGSGSGAPAAAASASAFLAPARSAPISDSPEGLEGPAGTSREARDGEGPLVLLVDDRLEILALHSSYLHQHGYSVLTAGDGETALEYARGHHPAVIVLDHSMPRRTGIEVARELKRDAATRGIPILMMTAHSYGAVGVAAKEAGCDRFLSKPVEPSRMLREVEALTSTFGGRGG